jgi:hypothetical protein
MRKRGQAWGFDLMIGSSLFIVGIIVLYLYALNYPTDDQMPVKDMSIEAQRISSIIFSEGYPTNWNMTNVNRPGFVSQGKINETQLNYFYNLSVDNYSLLKAVLRTNYNFYVFFSEPMDLGGNSVAGIGQYPTEAKNIIKYDRIVIYKNKPVNAYVYIWN